jgi:hypothetical protein
MKQRRTLALLSFLAPLGTIAACAFPDVTFAPDEIVVVIEAGTPDRVVAESRPTPSSDPPPTPQADAADTHDADQPMDASADAEASTVHPNDSGPGDEAGICLDAGVGRIDAASCTSCDCDNDGYNDNGGVRPSCAGSPPPQDCDDTDSRVHPDQLYLFDHAEPPWNGDWNCNHKLEKFLPEYIDCTALHIFALAGAGMKCSDVAGFTTGIACGETGGFVVCTEGPGDSCAVGTSRTDLKQACR